MCVMKVKDFTEETLDQIKEALTYRSDIDNYFSNFEWEEELSEKYKSRVDALDTFRKNLISDQENAKKDIEGREERVIALDSEIGTTMDNTCLELDDLISVLKELNQTIDSKGNFNANYDGTALRENINNIFNAKEIAQKLEEDRLRKEKELEEEQTSLKSAAEQLGIENFDPTDPSQVSLLLNSIDNYNRTHAGSEITYSVTDETRQKVNDSRNNIAEVGDPLNGLGRTIASMYGFRQIEGSMKWHNGIDIPADKGTPITSIWSGTVVATGGPGSGLGNYVVIELDAPNKGIYIKVGHMQDSTPLNMNDRVVPGILLGNVGDTDAKNQYHLHITADTDIKLSYYGNDINPSPYVGDKYKYPTISRDKYDEYNSAYKANGGNAEKANPNDNYVPNAEKDNTSDKIW